MTWGKQKHGFDLIAILSIWLIMVFASGAETWTSLDTPDSEFHASMAIFGSEVTDRASNPVYYWTRLGYIIPVRALTFVFGGMAGLEVYRLLLLMIIVSAIYFTLKRVTSRFNSIALTLLVVTNTVVLTYLGNPYPTANVMAGLFLIIAIMSTGDSRWREISIGAIGAVLVTTNPYGAALGAVVFLSLVVVLQKRQGALGSILRRLVLGSVGFFLTLVVLLGIGNLVFPNLNWWSTYTYWNSVINQADYIADPNRWTWDPSLLVIAMAAIIAWIVWFRSRTLIQTRMSVALATSMPVFALIYFFVSPNPYLEFPHYQAMLWPTALIAIALSATAVLPRVRLGWSSGLALVAGTTLTIIAGHSLLTFDLWQSRALALIGVVAFFLTRRNWILLFGGIVITFSVLQLLQNARDSYGVSSKTLYANAYRDNGVQLQIRSAIDAEKFVIAQTSSGDRVLTWVDADWPDGDQDLLPLAAFQLWGANSAEMDSTVSESTIERWRDMKPLSIVMYGKNLNSVLSFWDSIPKNLLPTPPSCLEVQWTDPEVAQVCVTGLTW